MADAVNSPAPHSKASEEATLGAMLLSPDSVSIAAASLTATDFHFPWHQTVYRAMLTLADARSAIDPPLLWRELERVGGVSEDASTRRSQQADLLALQTRACLSSDLPSHVKIVKDMSVNRQLMTVGRQLDEIGRGAHKDSRSALAEAERLLSNISATVSDDTSAKMGETFSNLMHSSSDLWLTGSEISGLTTGLRDLDKILLGLKPGSVNIIAGRPGMGKSVLTMNIASHVALELGLPVSFHTLEMNQSEVAKRFTAANADISHTDYTAGRLTNRDWVSIRESAVLFSKASMLIDEDTSASTSQVAVKARRLQAEYGQLGLIVVDYVGLMAEGGTASEKQSQIAKISRDLKVLAGELEVPIILVAQVGRGLESRADKRPRMSDLRDSGSLEQDASVVLFVYRDEVYVEPGAPPPMGTEETPPVIKGLTEIIVGKNRDGPLGTAYVAFSGERAKFMNLSTDV